MPSTFTIRDGYKVDVHSGTEFSATNSELQELLTELEHMNVSVPLMSFEFNRSGQSNEYTYDFETADSRSWSQVIYGIDASRNPGMTFDVSDQWKLEEFSIQRRIREIVIDMVVKYDVTLLKVEWTQ